LTDSQNDESMNELSARLDEIFGVDDEGDDEAEDLEAKAEKSPLQELNATVLTLEWEITDEMVSQLLEQVERLKDDFKDDYFAYSLLRLLGSVGKYVQTRKAASHPSALNLLNSLHTNLVKVVESGELSKKDKTALLQNEVKKFKQLKQLIAEEKGKRGRGDERVIPQRSESAGRQPSAAEQLAPGEPAEQMDATGSPVQNGVEPAEASIPREDAPAELHGDLALAVEEIKKTIREEFRALRDELQSLNNQR